MEAIDTGLPRTEIGTLQRVKLREREQEAAEQSADE
jgi:hypothetical protein